MRGHKISVPHRVYALCLFTYGFCESLYNNLVNIKVSPSSVNCSPKAIKTPEGHSGNSNLLKLLDVSEVPSWNWHLREGWAWTLEPKPVRSDATSEKIASKLGWIGGYPAVSIACLVNTEKSSVLLVRARCESRAGDTELGFVFSLSISWTFQNPGLSECVISAESSRKLTHVTFIAAICRWFFLGLVQGMFLLSPPVNHWSGFPKL